MKKNTLIFMFLIVLPASLKASYSIVAKIPQPHVLTSVSLTKDGTLFAFNHRVAKNSNEEAISIWNIETESPLVEQLTSPSELGILQHKEHKFDVHFHSRHLVERDGVFYKIAKGAHLKAEIPLAGPFPNVLTVTNTQNNKIVLTRMNPDSKTLMALSPRGNLLAVSHPQLNRVEIVDLTTHEIATLPSEPEEIVGPLKMVFFFRYKASVRIAVVCENTTMIYRKDQVIRAPQKRKKLRG